MHDYRGTTDRSGVPGVRRAGALVAGAAACAALTSVLLARASAKAAVVRGWLGDPGAALAVVRVDDVVEVAAVAVGLVLVGWFSVSLGAAAACATARVAGRRWTTGEHLVARYAPEVVRRALLLCAGTGLALGGGGLPALAAVDDAGGPAELGWTATLSLAPRAPSAVSDIGVASPGATPTNPAPAEVAAAPREVGADVPAGGTAVGSTGSGAPTPEARATTPAPATAATGAAAAARPGVSPPSSPPTATPSPAHSPKTAATGTPPVAAPTPPPALGVPTPPVGSPPPPSSTPPRAGAGEPSDPAVPASVTVRPGDTLWAIAAAHLPADADASDVAAAWPAWYAANLAVVGDDPDVIRPGQQLAVPTVDASTGAAR